jgi:hypothetical protein
MAANHAFSTVFFNPKIWEIITVAYPITIMIFLNLFELKPNFQNGGQWLNNLKMWFTTQ